MLRLMRVFDLLSALKNLVFENFVLSKGTVLPTVSHCCAGATTISSAN